VLYYYRHLIEDCLEPGFPSLIRSAECRRLEAMDLASLAAPLRRGRDEHFAGIVAYFQQVRQQPRRVDIRTASEHAFSKLHDIILHPTPESVALAAVRSRSQDFGKEENRPVVIIPADATARRPEVRLRRALWKTGQIALEFDDSLRREEQEKWLATAHRRYPYPPD
jgi:hypothetical protein